MAMIPIAETINEISTFSGIFGFESGTTTVLLSIVETGLLTVIGKFSAGDSITGNVDDGFEIIGGGMIG
jgi:hypothetical protein